MRECCEEAEELWKRVGGEKQIRKSALPDRINEGRDARAFGHGYDGSKRKQEKNEWQKPIFLPSPGIKP